MEGVDTGFDNVGGSVEIGLADFQVDDALALTLQGAGFVEDFESGFGAEPGHAAGKQQFVLRGLGHEDERSLIKSQTLYYTLQSRRLF